MTTSKVNSNSSSEIKMNNQTVRELRAVAKERGLRGYYKLRKAELEKGNAATWCSEKHR